jgi:hypothetical protein
VFSVSKGKRSIGVEASQAVANGVPDPTGMAVIPSVEHFIIEYSMPDDRRLSHIEIYKDANDDDSLLSEGNATLVYSGLNENFVYKIPESDLDKFHQFWIFSITRS